MKKEPQPLESARAHPGVDAVAERPAVWAPNALATARRFLLDRRAVGLKLRFPVLVLLLLVGVGCAHVGPRRTLEPRSTAREPQPLWVDAPLSWNKLDQIQAWLGNASVDTGSPFRTEGELQLAEGRLEFAERDLDASTVPPPSVRLRLQNAREAFEALLAGGRLTPSQRARAEIGRHRALAFLGAVPSNGLRIVERPDWNARPAITSRLTPLRGAWSRVTLHHSAETSSTDQGGSFDDSKRTLRLIQEHHIERNVWGDIGYHYVIDAAGRIFQARDLQWQGAHAGGENNYQNIGVCLLGNFERYPPTEAAMKSLELLLDELRTQHRIPASRVQPHAAYGVTACPGEPITQWLRSYQRR